jgi:hypothetical protein
VVPAAPASSVAASSTGKTEDAAPEIAGSIAPREPAGESSDASIDAVPQAQPAPPRPARAAQPAPVRPTAQRGRPAGRTAQAVETESDTGTGYPFANMFVPPPGSPDPNPR